MEPKQYDRISYLFQLILIIQLFPDDDTTTGFNLDTTPS